MSPTSYQLLYPAMLDCKDNNYSRLVNLFDKKLFEKTLLPQNSYLCVVMEYLSKERYRQIADELHNLTDVVYPKIKNDLAEARAQGDLSENAEYRAARSAQAKAISRIRFLQKVLEYSRVIDPDNLPKDCVGLLSTVTFTNLTSSLRMTYTIVSPHEMDLEKGKISLKSPIGQALMGKKAGDIAEVHAPAGLMRLRIESITREI